MTSDATPEKKEIIITWQDAHVKSQKLSQKIKNKRDWKKIVIITRGGLVPAALISRFLDIKHIETICIESYSDERQQHNMNVLKEYRNEDENILVIDDLADTGETLKEVRKMLPNAYFVALYTKPLGKEYLDEFVEQTPQNVWLYFPWEPDRV